MSNPEHYQWYFKRKGGTGGPEGLSDEEKEGHPAARPGTGSTVVWRSEEHRVSPWMRCLACGWYQDDFYNGDCACGAHNWENTGPTPATQVPQGQRVEALSTGEARGPRPISTPRGIGERPRPLGADGTSRLVVDQYPGSAVAEVLGGIARGMVVLLVGAAGVGKSTLAAQAGYVIARQLGVPLYWLDADQLKEELIEEAFVRARCPPQGLEGGVIPIHEEDEDGMPDFERACAWVPADGVLVADSLEAWAPRSDKQALQLLRLLRTHPARVKLVVAASNAAGGVAGDAELERAGDATVFVERTQIRVGKCRWKLGSTWVRCGPGGLRVERVDDVDDIAGPVAGAPQLSDETPLPEDVRVAYARLIRSWPWKHPVRASDIAKDLLTPGFDDLGDALRELLGAGDGSILSANEVGNALKVVRDVGLDGMKLTRDLDRKGIARWCLASSHSA